MSLKSQADQIVSREISKAEKVRLLCELVKEIPYSVQSSFDPEDLVKKGTGSCTPKHIFLANYFKKFGMKTKFLVVPFHYYRSKLKFAPSAMPIVKALPLAYHTALKVKVQEKYVIVDVTWDSKLKGFPINKNWDGLSDMELAVVPEELVETEADPREFTKPLKEKYSTKEKKAIEKFIVFFNKFCEKARE